MLKIILVVLLGILGFILGSNIVIPYAFSTYIAVAILAFLDSLFGALAASLQKKFNFTTFITGFFGNAIIAIFLVYLGQKLNVDIYLAAVIVFSTRLFNNFSILRRGAIDKLNFNKNKYKNKNNEILSKNIPEEYRD